MPSQLRANDFVGATFTGSTLLDDQQWERVRTVLRLSGREIEIARGVFDDKKDHAIANELGVSPHTVHSYLIRIYRKLGVASRLQLALRIVAEARAVEPSPSDH